MLKSHRYGIMAEIFVIAYLFFTRGMIPLKRRYRNKFGEIDLIFFKAQTFIFVEVKARNSSTFYDYDKIVSKSQKTKIIRAAQYFMTPYLKKDIYYQRFDVAIVNSLLKKPLHLSNVWQKDKSE